jgi:4-amino-4-deoxy-L-arabinose transferase-like glycosyltransferase
MSKKEKRFRQKKSVEAEKTAVTEKEVTSDVKRKAFGYFLNACLLLFFAYYFYKIYSFLGETYFWSDENVHAYISSVISKTHQIPFVLPEEIYGMREFSYPPMFHILSAIAMAIAGFSILKYINLILLICFVIGSYVLIRRYYGNHEASIACLLLSLSAVTAINTIRFMTDMLSMVLIFFSFFFVLLSLKESKKSLAVIAGLSTGLLLLTKQIGIVVLSFYGLLFAWFLLRKARDAWIVLTVVGVSVCIYLPYFLLTIINNVEVFGFLSAWLGDVEEKPKWAIEAVRSFQQSESSLLEFAILFLGYNGIILSISILLPLYYFIKVRSKDSPHHYIFGMLIYLAGAMVIWHITNARHTIVLLPLLTFLVGYSFVRIARKRYVKSAARVLLLIISFYVVYQMPDLRQRFNAHEEFRKIVSIIKEDDFHDGRVFSIHAFDVLMYTGKPVIWPYPDLENIPLDLVETQDAEDFYRLLKKYQIKYILIDSRYVVSDTFMGRNYPEYFHNNCITLSEEGKISYVALSKSNTFLLLRVI